MAYIGNTVGERFVASQPASVYSGDGSTTVFTLEHSVASDEDILVSVDGVVQEPSVAYAVSGGTTLTFTSAPSNNTGNNIFVYYLFRTVATVDHPSTSSLLATDGTFSGDLTVDTSTLHVDSANNRVGVLTVSPSAHLQVNGSLGNNTAIFTDRNGTSAVTINQYGNVTFANDVIASTLATDSVGTDMIFKQGASESMRLDSGNLFVGNTAEFVDGTGTGDTGIQINPIGLTISTRNGGISGIFGRQASDGDILQFRKDGSTVGSIGSIGGQPYFINSSNKGIRPYTNGVAAAGSAGAFDDDAQDLGASSVRWRNLYLSGGVYLGGTGSANYLDDYEEGTWTPTASTNAGTLSNASGIYTKVGKLVHVVCYFEHTGASTTANRVYGGLPFTVQNWNSSTSVDFFGKSWGNHGGYVYFQGAATNFNDNYARIASGSFVADGNVRIEGFYFTND